MIDKIVEKILSDSQETKSLIGVRKYDDDNDFYVGYVVDYSDKIIVLQHITKYGLEDGLLIEQMENIESFETDSDYLLTYQLLFPNASKIEKQTVKSIEVNDEENWQYEILKSKFDHGKMVTIEINNSDIVNHGYVLNFDETHVQINAISDVGVEDGTQIFKLTDITAFSVDRLESRKREALFVLKSKVK